MPFFFQQARAQGTESTQAVILSREALMFTQDKERQDLIKQFLVRLQAGEKNTFVLYHAALALQDEVAIQKLWLEHPEDCEKYFWEDPLCPKIKPSALNEHELQVVRSLADTRMEMKEHGEDVRVIDQPPRGTSEIAIFDHILDPDDGFAFSLRNGLNHLLSIFGSSIAEEKVDRALKVPTNELQRHFDK
jgi:hypothetical protein